MALSPMMEQYTSIKAQYPDCLLFFRLGDFYELFFDDAYVASRELELTLTSRQCGLEEKAPMCGVPYHASEPYIAKLVNKQYKVAICEQLEDPALTKGIVKRDVIRVVTPGTLEFIDTTAQNENVYICALYYNKAHKKATLSYADITTGQLSALEFPPDFTPEDIFSEIDKINPREIILSEGMREDLKKQFDDAAFRGYLNIIDASYFKLSNCEKAIQRQFNTLSLMSLDLDGKNEIIIATGALLLYLFDTQKEIPSQITSIEIIKTENYMQLDRSTIRNLELLETIYDGEIAGSLLGVLDKTKTAMGGRLLKRFIREPLNNVAEIRRRQDAVEILKNDSFLRADLREQLNNVYDFERLTARIASMRANGKDLIALKKSLEALPEIKKELASLDDSLLSEILSEISNFDDAHNIIETSIKDDPPFTVKDGDLIKDGYNSELDDLKVSIKDARDWIVNLETSERERTGIKTIKVGFNKVFGYYIDVSKSFIDKVPDNYIRKQTLVNNERYITPELKDKEQVVLKAESQINNLEYEIFRDVRDKLCGYVIPLQRASRAIAMLDVLLSFAEVAAKNGYCKPQIDESGIIDIKKGRHPAVEHLIQDGIFVSNETKMDMDSRSMLIITGPNMSGKSTYMRQTALIVLMAQMGSFVPAESARIGVVDRVFTRIGASDNLSRGQSTFFVEMSELAYILRNSTRDSLIILDEIGRGTSTFDGLSIAWATVEYLCTSENRARTMFATHYHELTELADQYDCVQNLSVAVDENGKDIVFLHKIVEGPANKSYGIHVAKIAGIPKEIRKTAEKKLKSLEEEKIKKEEGSQQLSIFLTESFESTDFETETDTEEMSEYRDFVRGILDIDIDNLTPLQAINKLKELQDDVIELEK